MYLEFYPFPPRASPDSYYLACELHAYGLRRHDSPFVLHEAVEQTGSDCGCQYRLSFKRDGVSYFPLPLGPSRMIFAR